MQAFYWVSIIALILLIAAAIWLLARGGGTVCDNKGKLNENCSDIKDCNSGLVCTVSSGGDGVCKVSSGGVCETSSECAQNLTCQNGTCQGRAGGLNDPCPCGEGFTCVNNVCKVKVGGPCMTNADCADSNCSGNVCTVFNSLVAAAQAAGITNLDDLIVAAQNRCGGCNDSDCDCDGNYKSNDHSDHSDHRSSDSKYYYSDTDSYSGRHKKKKSYSSDRSKSQYGSRSRDHCNVSDTRSRYYGSSSDKSSSYKSNKSSRSNSSNLSKYDRSSYTKTSDTSCYKTNCSDTHFRKRY